MGGHRYIVAKFVPNCSGVASVLRRSILKNLSEKDCIATKKNDRRDTTLLDEDHSSRTFFHDFSVLRLVLRTSRDVPFCSMCMYMFSGVQQYVATTLIFLDFDALLHVMWSSSVALCGRFL